MNIKQQLRNNFPNSFKKTSREFSALIANDSGTAVMEKLLTDMTDYMKSWYTSSNIYEQTDDMLDKSSEFISFFTRFNNETDTALINRLQSVFLRNGDTKNWGTVKNIKNVFQQYFKSATIYLIENSRDFDDYNLIENGEFDSSEGWTLSGAELTEDAAFMNSNGVEFADSGDSLSQEIAIENTESKTYCLHFFLKGSINVTIKNSDGNYWNDDTKAWQSTTVNNSFTSSESWNNETLWLMVTSDITSLTFTFTGSSAYVDYVRLFEKPLNGCFTILVYYSGDVGGDSMNLAPGSDDPVSGVDYDQVSYIDQASLTGAASGKSATGYKQILELVRPVGVEANLQIIVKDTSEE